ncbi:MAG: hypothetical protein JO246_16700, partial [Frankiaceae bacterium]|nr:hypothetical protein [Frankiaceae bacterium]
TRRRSAYLVLVALGVRGVVQEEAPAPANPEHQHCGATADSVPPAITKIAVDKSKVHVRKHDKTVRVSVDAHDVASGTPVGVKKIRVLFESGRRLIGRWHTMTLSEGTTTSGTWVTDLVVPNTSLSGEWFIAAVVATDLDGNEDRFDQGRYNFSHGPHDLTLFPDWPTRFEVVGHGTAPTKHASRLTNLTFSTDSVNTVHHAKAVEITATVSRPEPVAVRVGFSERPSPRRVYISPIRLEPQGHGTWSGAVTIDRWVHSFTLRPNVRITYGADSVRGHRKYSSADLDKLGFPSSVAVKSGVDHHKPVLTDFSITPDSVDTTSSPQQVTITATARDTESGLSWGYVYVAPHPDAADHPVGQTEQAFSVDGDTASATVTIARCVLSGTWNVSMELGDAAGREIGVHTKQLEAKGFPGTLTVSSDPPGYRRGPYIKGATKSVADHTITLTFQRPVKGATLDNLLVYRANHFAQPVPTTAIECRDGTTTVPCDGSSGLATTVTLTVPTLDERSYLVSPNQDSVVPQVTDEDDNPVPWWG